MYACINALFKYITFTDLLLWFNFAWVSLSAVMVGGRVLLDGRGPGVVVHRSALLYALISTYAWGKSCGYRLNDCDPNVCGSDACYLDVCDPDVWEPGIFDQDIWDPDDWDPDICDQGLH